MIIYEPMPGTRIEDAAQHMVEMAAIADDAVILKFNDTEITTKRGSTVEEVMRQWNDTLRVAQIAYRISPEGKAAALDAKQRQEDAQAKIDHLMKVLPYLVFDDLSMVVDWFGHLQDPSDHSEVNVPVITILREFSKQGWLPGMNVGNDFDSEDADNYAHYIVGQALDMLGSVGAIHHIYHKFADEWREKFGTKSEEEGK